MTLPGAIPHVPALGAGEVHVWTMRLDAGVARHEARLFPAEREAQLRFVRAHDRAMFALSHGTRRELLAAYLDVAPASLAFGANAWGKPHLAIPTGGLRFNVSHSGDVALLAVTRGRDLGVDVEEARDIEDLDALARTSFSPAERAALRSAPPAARTEAFFACWSRKEAVIKAIGMGLSFPLDAFDVSLDPTAPPRLVASRDARLDPTAWSMHAIAVPPGYAGALMVSGPPAPVRQLAYPVGVT